MKICILGAGSWGIAITKLLTHNGHEVSVWSIDPEEIAMLNEYCEHKTKLPGVILSGAVTFTTDMKTAINDSDMIVMAVPSPFVRSTAKTAAEFVKEGQIIVSVSKGIEEYQKKKDGALLIITHSTKILESLHVDYTHVLVKGNIVHTGDGSLVDEINANGFERFVKED